MKPSLAVVKRASAALVSGAALVLIAGCGGGSDTVSKPEDAPPGTCVSLSGTDAKSQTVTKVACDGSGELSFYSAGTVAQTATCATENYSYVTFPDSTTKLCLAVNMTAGNCYQINPDDIADYRRVDCGTAPTGNATVYKVVSRSDGTPQCAAGQLSVEYQQPTTFGYCLEKGGPTA